MSSTERDREHRKIPGVAKAASSAAYKKSLADGIAVVVEKNGEVVRVAPDGSRTFVKEAGKKLQLGKGKRYRIK